jgi:hypothetical protein
MTGEHLSNRANSWQKLANKVGSKGENVFAEMMKGHLPDHYRVVPKPGKIVLYSNKKGVELDCKIENTLTGKELFVEVKSGNNGGNAHERGYKFASPMMQERVHKLCPNTPPNPFFWVFAGKTFASPESYIHEYGSKGKIKTKKVDPQKYRDEFETIIPKDRYAIVDLDLSNVSEIARKVMDII